MYLPLCVLGPSLGTLSQTVTWEHSGHGAEGQDTSLAAQDTSPEGQDIAPVGQNMVPAEQFMSQAEQAICPCPGAAPEQGHTAAGGGKGERCPDTECRWQKDMVHGC